MWQSSKCILAGCAIVAFSASGAQISAPRAITERPANLRSDTPVDGSSLPVVSADAKFVAFISRSPNVATNSSGGSYQVFLRDLSGSNVVLISATPGNVAGNDHSTLPTLSSNAAFIAFESEATDLVPGDTNRVSDVFVRDVFQRRTLLVSSGNGPARSPIISEDGRYVVFETYASNLVSNDTNTAADVVRYDLTSGTTELVSVNLAGQPANRGSQLLSTTPDGRFIAFWSSATDISLEATNTIGEAYVRDMQTGATFCLSENEYSTPGELRRFNAILTPDGQYAAIQKLELGESFTPPGAEGEVRRVDVFSGTVTNASDITRVRGSLGISDDGNLLIFYNRSFSPLSNYLCLRNLSVSTNRALVPVSTDVGSYKMSKDFGTLFFTMLVGTNYQFFKHDLVQGSTHLLSTNALGEPLDTGVSSPFSIDASGSVVAFETPAGDAGVLDFNGAPDVYTVGHHLVAPRDPSLSESTGPGLVPQHRPSITANGATIAFAASDGFLVANDFNKQYDIFLANVNERVITQASINTAGLIPGLVMSAPILSADGGSMLFKRSSGDTCCDSQVEHYWIDLETGDLRRPFGSFPSTDARLLSQDGRWLVAGTNRIWVSDFRTPALPGQASNQVVDVRYDGTGPGNSISFDPTISLDGEWVAFLSYSTDLTTNTGFYPEVPNAYAWNVLRRQTRLLNVSPATGAPLPFGASNLVFSGDGRFVAYETFREHQIYRHDLTIDAPSANLLICSGCSEPSISGDGQVLAYLKGGQIHVHEVATGATANLGGSLAVEPVISVDGRFVLFVAGPSSASQVFLHDRWQATTHLLSRNYEGTGPGNGPSTKPVMSPNGRTIAFNSFASDLVLGDFNGKRDLFIVQIAPADTDADGIDDDWEMHYFQTLARDGTANADGDHQTDAQEYLAGTSPLDASSALRFTDLKSRSIAGMQDTELRWIGAPGRTYRVQHQSQINAAWDDLPGEVMVGGHKGAASHVTSNRPSAFYRVMLVE